MKANLHLHSRLSDGTDWPADAVSRASAAGLAGAALTDHDTFGGTAEFLAAAAMAGLYALPGIEIDCVASELGYRSELLAYFPAGSYGRTAAVMADICRARLAYVRDVVERARRHFVDPGLSFEGLLERKRSGRSGLPPEAFSFNKVDLYRYFRDSGAIPQDLGYKAFKKAYLDSKLLASSAYDKPTCEEIVRLVRSDGGFAVVPHLGHEFDDSADTLRRERKRLKAALDYFRSIGCAGVELYWYRNQDTSAINRIIRKEAADRGFFLTYGSDCHGPDSGKETMGVFSGNFTGFPLPIPSGP